jgi:hypothetical protein
LRGAFHAAVGDEPEKRGAFHCAAGSDQEQDNAFFAAADKDEEDFPTSRNRFGPKKFSMCLTAAWASSAQKMLRSAES